MLLKDWRYTTSALRVCSVIMSSTTDNLICLFSFFWLSVVRCTCCHWPQPIFQVTEMSCKSLFSSLAHIKSNMFCCWTQLVSIPPVPIRRHNTSHRGLLFEQKYTGSGHRQENIQAYMRPKTPIDTCQAREAIPLCVVVLQQPQQTKSCCIMKSEQVAQSRLHVIS